MAVRPDALYISKPRCQQPIHHHLSGERRLLKERRSIHYNLSFSLLVFAQDNACRKVVKQKNLRVAD
jgi:hypothetical protein